MENELAVDMVVDDNGGLHRQREAVATAQSYAYSKSTLNQKRVVMRTAAGDCGDRLEAENGIR